MAKPKTETKADTSPKVYQREKIDYTLKIRELPWTEKQKALMELANHKDTRVVLLSGPAGSSKTLTAVRIGLELLNTKRVSDIICVRAAIESSEASLGFLPGTMEEKLGNYMVPFADKFEELLTVEQVKRLHTDKRIINQPIGFTRGCSWTARYIIVDEAQSICYRELQTLLTRIGKFTKMIICADPEQSDLPHNRQGGFTRCSKIFDTNTAKEFGIFSVNFGKEDIMRSDLCKFIVETFENEKLAHDHGIVKPSPAPTT